MFPADNLKHQNKTLNYFCPEPLLREQNTVKDIENTEPADNGKN